MARLPKLEAAPLWPAVAAIAVASILLWTLVPGLVETSAAEQLRETLRLLSPLLAADVAGEPAQLQARVTRLTSGSSLRATVVDGEGLVLADSARTPAEVTRMDRHLDRAEIAAALATGSGRSVRRSATTGVVYAYAARTFTGPDGRLYVLRLAQPLDALDALRSRLGWILLLASGAALGVAGIIALWLRRRFFRPLAGLVESAGALASGERPERLEPPHEPHLATLTAALNLLAERVEEQIAAARAERDELEVIVRSLPDGVLVTDGDGRALLANPEFRRLFGLPDAIAGRSPLELTRRPELAQIVAAALASAADASAVAQIRAPGRRSVALSATRLAPRAAGERASATATEAAGVVVVAHDVTQATRLDEMRRDFVANVSHELKTPLAAIRGFAETLRDGALDDPPAAQRFVSRILEQCRRLQDLLEDLLTLSRLESLEERPQTGAVDLLALLHRTVELIEDAAAARGVTVSVEPADRALPPVVGDSESLERLATNLLDNAVKYNRDGGTVTVRLRPGGPGEAVLEVSDTGIGIPAASLPRLFERFYRVDKGRARDEGGTGLGLAIVKHVAQSAGGRVEVDSEPGVGSTFRVVLPLAGVARRTHPQRKADR